MESKSRGGIMAENPDLIASLKSCLPENSWSWVVPALMQDPVIWSSLQDVQFLQRVIDQLSEPEEWNPARLALIKLNRSGLEDIDAALIKESEATIEAYVQGDKPFPHEHMDIQQAAYISIGLNERYKTSGWDEIKEILDSIGGVTGDWLTPFAVIFGLVPDQNEFLHSFYQANLPTSYGTQLIRAVLCQPIPPDELFELIQNRIDSLSIENTIRILRTLNVYHPELTQQLAADWIENHSPIPQEIHADTFSDQLQQIMDYLSCADIYALAGQLSHAEKYKSSSLDHLNTIQSEVKNQLVSDSLQTKNLEWALSTWTTRSTPSESIPPVKLFIELLQSGRLDDSLMLLPDTEVNNRSPLHWLNDVFSALAQDEINQARLFAQQGIDTFIDNYESDSSYAEKVLGSQRDAIDFLRQIIHLLMDLSLYPEAVQAAKIATQVQPNDPKLFILLCQTGRAAGDLGISIQAAEFAVIMKPTDAEYRRQLCISLEANGDWNIALPERQEILDHRFAQPDLPSWPTSADLLAVGKCALHADQPEKALEVCQKAIDLSPSDGHAHALLGEALSKLGNENQAMEHFILATQLAPHESEPWLSLSNAYHRSDQIEKAIETLCTASHAVPNDPTIFYALGQIHLEDNATTLAQSALNRAYELITKPHATDIPSLNGSKISDNDAVTTHHREIECKISVAYGETLESLGHYEQAMEVYSHAYLAYPSFPGLAYTYAKMLMKSGDDGAALAPLAIAVASKPSHPDPYLDYARILISSGEQPKEAVKALEKALIIFEDSEMNEGDNDQVPSKNESINSSAYDMTIGMLAQAQEAAGNFLPALQTYSQALESSLAKDQQWKTSLAIGMGRVALQLEQPEVAIAALQDFREGEIQDPLVAQILCEAYSAINLTQEALYAARTAVHLAPDDVEMLAWFADRAIELGIIAEAIPALTSAAQLDPKRTDLIIRLGDALNRIGKHESARNAYLSTLSSPHAQSEHLYQAANGLSELGDNESAASCLERALELQPNPPLSLVLDLANAYDSADNCELALRTVEKGIELDSENVILYSFKAELLQKLGRSQAAQACLEHALILHPDDSGIHIGLAQLLRESGEIISASDHANKSVNNLPADPSNLDVLIARGVAAELARAMLQDDNVHTLLEGMLPNDDGSYPQLIQPNNSLLLDFFCIYSESALDREEQIAAAASLNLAYKILPDHPRVLALQARLAKRQGNRSSAVESYEAALKLLENEKADDQNNNLSSSSLLGVAFAAIEFFEWETAFNMLENAIALAPNESFLHLQKARALVLRAEFQRICLTLDIVNHSPGSISLSPKTFRIFEESIQEVHNTLSPDFRAEKPLSEKRWHRRGNVAFDPTPEAINSLQEIQLKPDDQAALFVGLSISGDSDSLKKLYYSLDSNSGSKPLHHNILANYALAMNSCADNNFDFEDALGAILAAIQQNQTEPIYYAIHAKLCEAIHDHSSAISAINTALSIWPNEPRWLAYAAQLSLINGQPDDAINNLEMAISSEPDHISHYLALGDAHLKYGVVDSAIGTFQKANQIAPDHFEVFLALATAHLINEDYSLAVKNTEKAITLAPQKISPLLLRAEIALKMDDPRQANAHAEAALRMKSDHSGALYIKARAVELLGDTEESMSIVEKAIPLSSDPVPLLLHRAHLRSNLEGSQSYLAELQELSLKHPDEPLVLVPLAENLAEADRIEESIQVAQQALRYSNGHLPIDEQVRLRQLLGSLLRKSGQLDQAVYQLTEAIQNAPNRVEIYLELGLTHEERRQHGAALDAYKNAIKSDPTDPRPYIQAGLLLKSSRDYPAAESMLRRAAELSPEDITIHRQLAALVALNLVHNRQPVTSDI